MKELERTVLNLMKMAKTSPKGLKTLWEKEKLLVKKLLVKSNFSFALSVFKRLALQTRKNQSLFGKGLKPSGSLSTCSKMHTVHPAV